MAANLILRDEDIVGRGHIIIIRRTEETNALGIDLKHTAGIDNEVFLFGNRLGSECFSLGACLQLLLYEHVVLEAMEFGCAVLRFNRRISGRRT